MVLLVVQETVLDVGDLRLWYGGFTVESLSESLGKSVLEKVVQVCNVQLALLRRWAENKDDQELLQRLSKVFPERANSAVVVDLGEIDGWLDGSSPVFDAGKAMMWWVKKPFDLDQSISKRVGTNEKTKVKIYLTQDNDGLILDDDVKQQVDALYEKHLKQAFASLKTETTCSSSTSETTNHFGSPAKKRKTVVDLSYLVHNNNDDAEKAEEDDSEELGWKLPDEKLESLKQNKELFDQLDNAKLLGKLVNIDKSSDRLKTLQDTLDSDSEFAKFVDKILETIGAQKVVSDPDGSNRRIESCINDILERVRPSFLNK